MDKKITPFWLLFILTGLNLFNYIDRYVLSAVRTPLATDFGLGYGDSGRLFTVFMLGYFITSPLFGYLGDRASRKWLIASGIFVWSLGTVLTGLAADLWQLLFFRIHRIYPWGSHRRQVGLAAFVFLDRGPRPIAGLCFTALQGAAQRRIGSR